MPTIRLIFLVVVGLEVDASAGALDDDDDAADVASGGVSPGADVVGGGSAAGVEEMPASSAVALVPVLAAGSSEAIAGSSVGVRSLMVVMWLKH